MHRSRSHRVARGLVRWVAGAVAVLLLIAVAVLVAVPLVALLSLGVFIRFQLADIETRSRFVAESRIAALATLGNLSRGFAELRVNMRSHLLATTPADRASR